MNDARVGDEVRLEGDERDREESRRHPVACRRGGEHEDEEQGEHAQERRPGDGGDRVGRHPVFEQEGVDRVGKPRSHWNGLRRRRKRQGPQGETDEDFRQRRVLDVEDGVATGDFVPARENVDGLVGGERIVPGVVAHEKRREKNESHGRDEGRRPPHRTFAAAGGSGSLETGITTDGFMEDASCRPARDGRR